MKTTTDFQLVATDKLIPYVNNARTHSPEQIKKLRSHQRCVSSDSSIRSSSTESIMSSQVTVA